MESYLNKFGKINVVALFFTALLFPAIFGYAKVVFLIGFFLSALLLWNLEKRQERIFNQCVIIFLCLIIGLNLFFVLRGVLNGASNEAVEESLYIYVLYPLFYMFFIAALPQVLSVRALTAVLLAISIVTSYIVIAHVFRIRGVILPGYEMLYFVYSDLSGAFSTLAFSGETGYAPRVMERLIFLAPFSVVLVAVRKSIGLNRFVVWSNLTLIMVAIFVSERRAMAVVLLLALLGVFVRWVILRPKHIVVVGLVKLGVVMVAVFLVWWSTTGFSFDIARLGQNLTSVIASHTEGALIIRGDQFARLIAAAGESPLLGEGFGSVVSGYARDPDHPWRFELTYVALLFQTGFLGVILYTIVFILLVAIAINSFKKSGDVILPYIFGLAGGLVAVATNPYLSYGTGQWILFLPLAVFNCVLLEEGRKVTVERSLSN